MPTSDLVTYALGAAIALFVLYKIWEIRQAILNRVPPEDAKRLVREGATLVDVRTEGEFHGGHLDGALNIPLHTLGGSLDRLPREEPIVVYCHSGMRSARAAKLLRGQGFEGVHDLGPMTAYPG